EKVGPGNLLTVLHLDWPKKAASFIKVYVIWPAIKRCESLLTATAATSTIAYSVGSRAMPSHSDKESAIVTEISWPPVLGIGHELAQICFKCIVIELVKLFPVAEIFSEWVRLFGVLRE